MGITQTDLPTLRWGVIGTGLISSWFAADLVLPRKDAKARHIIQAIGSSSQWKGDAFVDKVLPGLSPTVYPSHVGVYTNPDVDIVYIGTPHAFHARNCLDAIAAGKHVLCEKPFAMNARQAEEVFAAAAKQGVFVMEAVWTRFTPLVQSLQIMLHEDHVIGHVRRVFCDFSLPMALQDLGLDSRLKNPALGAGSLLDIGMYSLTWGLLALGPAIGDQAEVPSIHATQHLVDGVDVASAMLLDYKSGSQGILTSSLFCNTGQDFCRIEGTEGHIVVRGVAASAPNSFTVYRNSGRVEAESGDAADEQHKFEKPGFGFYYEADAVAMDVTAGRTQNGTMPWAETLRVMRLLDEVRRQGGARFPQDDEVSVKDTQ